MHDKSDDAGLFISFEGIDGTGKTTQLRLLQNYLVERGKTVVTLREPGGTDVSERVRDLLLNQDVQMTPMAELLLFSSARAQMVAEVVRPALERGDTILCDRYVDSSTAYQGFGRMLDDYDWIYELHRRATAGVMPHRTYLIDLPIDVARERRRGHTADRMETAQDDFYTRVKQGYDWLLEKEPERLIRIDGTRSVDEIHQDIKEDIARLLNDEAGTASTRSGSPN